MPTKPLLKLEYVDQYACYSICLNQLERSKTISTLFVIKQHL